jgi:hypothetical protein
MNPLAQELIRQGLRWLGVWLMTTQKVPAEMAALVDDPQTAAFISGIVSYLIADVWWGSKKVAGK